MILCALLEGGWTPVCVVCTCINRKEFSAYTHLRLENFADISTASSVRIVCMCIHVCMQCLCVFMFACVCVCVCACVCV